MQNRFDNAAQEWDSRPLSVQLNDSIGKAIIENIPLNGSMRVLDVGCGTGLISFTLSPLVGEVVGIDSSKGMVERFEQKAQNSPNTSCMLLDLDSDELPLDSFDLIVSAMAFHHLKEPQKIMKKLCSSLKAGGRIAIADLFSEDGTFHDDNSGIWHFGFSPEEISGWYENVKIKNLRIIAAHSVTKNSSEYPIFLSIAEL